MRAIPAQARPFKVEIENVDVTDIVSDIGWARDSLSFTQGEILHWRGNLTLNKRMNPANTYNLDDRTNLKLKKGSVVKIYVAQTLNNLVLERTLRIKKAFYDRNTESTTIELIDILELFSYKSDAETDLANAEKEFKDCLTALPEEMTSKTYSQVARELLIKAGIPEEKINLSNTNSLRMDFFLDKGTESYITIAAKLLFVDLLFLEVDKDENIITNKWNSRPSITFARNEYDLISMQRIQNPEDSFSIVKASSNRKKAVTLERNSTTSQFYETRDFSSFGEANKTIINGTKTIFLCPPIYYVDFFSVIFITRRPYSVIPVSGVTRARNEIFNFWAEGSIFGRFISYENLNEITNFARNNPVEKGKKTSSFSESVLADYNDKGFTVSEQKLKLKRSSTDSVVTTITTIS